MALNPARSARPGHPAQRWLRRLAGRGARRGLLLALAALALLATWDAVSLWREQRWNTQIGQATALAEAAARAGTVVAGPAVANPAVPAAPAAAASVPTMPWDEASAAAVPELQFAQAHALALHGAADAALGRYGQLGSASAVGQAARFNAANLLLRQGQQLRAGAQPGQALALIELAKEGYRELLRQQPEHWAARYNLERAQRLLPDPDEADEDGAAPARQAERAATTMRGYSPGLP